MEKSFVTSIIVIAIYHDAWFNSADKFNTWSNFLHWAKKPIIRISVVILDVIVATWVDISILV